MDRSARAALQSRRRCRWLLPFVSGRIVDLIQQIHVLVLAKDMRHIGHILFAIAHQQVGCVLVSIRCPLAGQQHRAQLHRNLLQIGHIQVRLERTHVARLVFTHDKLQVVAPGRERKTRGVLNVPPLYPL